MPSASGTRVLALGGTALFVAGLGALIYLDRAHGTLRAEVAPDTVAWFLVAFVGFALLMVGTQARTGTHADRVSGRKWIDRRWPWLVGLGLVARLALLVTEPTLSDDVYRYLWEGHLVTEGVSPYAFHIDAPEGAAYAIEARQLANNTSLASPYLPVAHLVFGSAAFVLPSEPWTMQVIMIAFDCLAFAMLVRLLSLAAVPRNRALLYWLNPLVIVEVAHGAHIDAMITGIAFAGLVLTFASRDNRTGWAARGGPFLVGLSTLTRPLTVLFVPVLFWQWRWSQRLVYGATVGGPIAVIGAWVGFGFDDSGTGVFGSARAYTETFRFNSAIYQPLERWIGSQGLDDRGWNEPVALARLLVFAAVAGLLLWVFVRARAACGPRQVLRWLAVPLMIYALFTPVLHPWYILLLLALVPALAPGSDEPAVLWLRVVPWLVLSALLIFSYLTYEDPSAFAERTWVRRLQWWPTFALLAFGVVRTKLTGQLAARAAVRSAIDRTES